MQYSITYNNEKQFILITLVGEIDIPIMQKAINEADQVIIEHQCNRIIGDFRETLFSAGTLDILHLYEFWIKTLKANHIAPTESKRVIFIKPDQKNWDNFHFFETISVNRNSRVKIFYDLDKAVEWICK